MITVRPATPADRPALGRLGALLLERHHAFDPDRFIPPIPETERGYGAFLERELQREGSVVLVAEEAGQVLGYVYGRLEGNDWLALRGPAAVIHDLMVDPARQRAGIGRRLLEEMISRLTALGAPRIVLSTAQRNEEAQRLFASAGFRPTMIEMTREISE
jgi:ribosomal protein S18 acetylase RimI-like enzyme